MSESVKTVTDWITEAMINQRLRELRLAQYCGISPPTGIDTAMVEMHLGTWESVAAAEREQKGAP